MAGVPERRDVWLATAFVGYAALAAAAALGALHELPSVTTLLMLVGVLPFLIGAFVRRAWSALALFVVVAGTAFLPDRTVVEATTNSVNYTTYTTSLVPTLMFATVSGVAALAGVAAARPSRVAKNSLLLALIDSWRGRLVLMLAAWAVGGPLLLAAVAVGLVLRILQSRR